MAIQVTANQQFDRLTTIRPADPVYARVLQKDEHGNIVKDASGNAVYAQGKTKYKTWLCQCSCGKQVVVKESDLKKKTEKGKSCGCACEPKRAYQSSGKLRENERADWEELYEYVRREVMGLPSYMGLTSRMVIRLKGMQSGQKFKNNRNPSHSYYPYKIILYAFKYSIGAIRNAQKKTFSSDEGRFAYMCAIAESNLNLVFEQVEAKIRANKALAQEMQRQNEIAAPVPESTYSQKPKPVYDYKGLLDDIM